MPKLVGPYSIKNDAHNSKSHEIMSVSSFPFSILRVNRDSIDLMITLEQPLFRFKNEAYDQKLEQRYVITDRLALDTDLKNQLLFLNRDPLNEFTCTLYG